MFNSYQTRLLSLIWPQLPLSGVKNGRWRLVLLIVCSALLLYTARLVLNERWRRGEASGSKFFDESNSALAGCVKHKWLLSIADSRTMRYETLAHPIPIENALTPVCLSKLLEREADAHDGGTDSLRVAASCFPPRLERLDAVNLVLTQLKHELESNLLTYALDFGSLLGSLRHFGCVPWDDDLDFVLPYEERPNSLPVLRRMADSSNGTMVLTIDEDIVWRLHFMCTLSQLGTCKVFIDFLFYSVDSNGRMKLPTDNHPKQMPKSQFFPLRLRPFGTNLLWVPNNPFYLTQQLISKDFLVKCKDSGKHKTNVRTQLCKSRPTVPCWMLRSRYPTTVRVPVGGLNHPVGLLELLVLDETVVKVFYDPSSTLVD